MMNILLTGGSGFVGQSLAASLLEAGHGVVSIGRSASHPFMARKNFSHLSADTTQRGPWQEEAAKAAVIINLTGTNIFRYWTRTNKQKIYESRILTTRHIVEAIQPGKPVTLLNASAAGFYGDRGDEPLTEEAIPGNDFLAQVCMDWEKEAFLARTKGSRAVAMRFGVVLGKKGGALAKMSLPYRFFMGGPLGSGNQWFPWIHMDDLIQGVHLAIQAGSLDGPVNFVSPASVRQKAFAKAMGQVLGKPSLMPVPAPLIRLLMGELGRAFLAGQRVYPEKLLKSGMTFRFPELMPALIDALEAPD